MGCDIHIAVERHTDKGWVGDLSCSVDDSRNYSRFAALAGVRGDGPKPRGVPGDISDSAGMFIDDYGPDGHSHSWLPAEEAGKIFYDTDRNQDRYKKEYPESNYFGIEEEGKYRVIFFFDN